MDYILYPIGVIRSSLKDRSQCPHQGNEGAPEAWVEVEPEYVEGLGGFEPGMEIVILTWMHLADRSILSVHPKNDQSKPLTGVFRTRSADRPNPIGLHRVTVVAIESPTRLLVKPVEVVDKTPILDIKCVLENTE
jgi:tRNA-Thr(GGU) m(6)t(6)A37 methyltransferase TsaA